MGWRIVKQPNGLYARFSDVVDSFTHLNLTAEDVIDVSRSYGCNDDEANAKLRRANDDEIDPEEATDPLLADGLNRWREALSTIDALHGPSERGAFEAEGVRTR